MMFGENVLFKSIPPIASEFAIRTHLRRWFAALVFDVALQISLLTVHFEAASAGKS